jgi:RNA polymerase sigma factor (TIGR02999 family)
MNETHKITRMLHELNCGDSTVFEELMPLVYDELHRQAARYLRRERPGHSLQTTALIHETFLKLIDQNDINCESRNHFFAISANLMRQVLVDHAKSKHRQKRGGKAIKISLEHMELAAADENTIDLIALDEALNHLAAKDEQQARVVELRFFSGFSLEETAEVLGISRTTAARDWAMAKAWLHRELTR